MFTYRFHQKNFSVIELLFAVSILSLLLTLLSPSLKSVIYRSKHQRCLFHQKQMTNSAIIYSDDNQDMYPFRGSHPTHGPTTARFANRFREGYDPITDLRDLLSPYVSPKTQSWVCPLYLGTDIKIDPTSECSSQISGLLGCQDHGLSHKNYYYGSKKVDLDTMSYWFYAGLAMHKNNNDTGRHSVNGRYRIGDPYIVATKKGNSWTNHNLNILWGDDYSIDRTNKINGVNYVSTLHEPPPESLFLQKDDSSGRLIVISGPLYINWSFDDGSARTQIIEETQYYDKPKNVIKVPYAANHYLGYPNDE